MKKSLVVLLIMVLVSSFAFAEITVDDASVHYNSLAVAPKDSVTLNGSVGASYVYHFDTKAVGFEDSATLGYFNLKGSKVLVSGLGSFKGEGEVYAAVDASLEVKAKLAPEWKDKESAGLFDLTDDGEWTIDNVWKFVDSDALDSKYFELDKITFGVSLKIDNFYIAKDGAWKLNLMKSDAYLNYATSSIDYVKEYHKDNAFKTENVQKKYASYSLPLTKQLGAILTLENSEYLSEVSFGMSSKNAFNFLVKSADVALDNVTLNLGFVAGKDIKTAKGMIGTGLKLAYADDVVTATAAADFGFEDTTDPEAFNADVQFDVAAAGFTGNFYYSTTKDAYNADTDYVLDWATKAKTTAFDDDNYVSAKLAYAFDYAGVDFEVGVTGKNLNYAGRTFGFAFSAANDAFTFDAAIDWTPSETTSKIKPQVSGDFDVTYTAAMFDVYADFEFLNVEDAADTKWGINLGVETDKVVAGATFGIDFCYSTMDSSKAPKYDLDPVKAIKAFCKVAF